MSLRYIEIIHKIFKFENQILILSILLIIYSLILLIRRKPFLIRTIYIKIICIFFYTTFLIAIISGNYINNKKIFVFDNIFYLALAAYFIIRELMNPNTYHIFGIYTDDFKEILSKTLQSLSLKNEFYGSVIFMESNIDISYHASPGSGDVEYKIKHRNNVDLFNKINTLLKENITCNNVRFNKTTVKLYFIVGIILLSIFILLKYILKI